MTRHRVQDRGQHGRVDQSLEPPAQGLVLEDAARDRLAIRKAVRADGLGAELLDEATVRGRCLQGLAGEDIGIDHVGAGQGGDAACDVALARAYAP